ncbi:hypothetical protein BG015_003040 [Linnemannia schmuckeri]|uniref:Uncharacterized protein n=1 Tax=Linnemannia schmuckeri TaxID=64567 RepID=A0A9P5VCY7_9FUNG|nr:hypothetical protein BG015_003040 [Linnemannia schmuckeri]
MDRNTTDPGASPLPNTTVPTSKAMNSVTAAFIILGVTVGAILLHLVLSYIFKKIAEKTIWQFDDDVVKYCKKPTFIMFPTIGLLITIQLVTLPVGVYGVLNHVFIIILIFSITLFVVMLIKCGSMAVARSNSRMKESDMKRAREVETQIVVMTRIVQGMVWLLGLSGIAMTFPNAWQVGVSLLASASVTALLLGVAAKPAIENAIASLAIALTQPFLLEDQVEVDGEVGHIEEIQSQYVIMRTLDERRLVIPLTWFLANIFQNWSRNSAQQIGICKIFVDYTTAIPRIRQYFLRFARAHPLYDGRHCSLLVTDCTLGTIELTCQISVANAMDVMQVSSDIREAMVEFIARSRLEVSTTGTSPTSIRGLANLRADLVGGGLAGVEGAGGSGGGENVVNEHGEIVQAPPPPLTTEDVKMGSGSKAYQKIIPSTTASKDVATGKDADTEAEKEKLVSGTTTALNVGPGAAAAVGSRRDHIQVTVEDADAPSGNGSAAVVPGLTRRSVGGGGGPDAVVSSLEEAQQKIRSMVDMAMNYVVEPQPLVVPAVPETLDALVEQLSSGLSLSDSNVTTPAAEEEVWDGEAFGVRLAGLGKLVSNDITKVSLACKPPADPKVVIGMMDGLAESCFRLAGFVDSIPVKIAGQTYKREVQILANDIFIAVAGLLNEFLDIKVERVLQIQQQKSVICGAVEGLHSGGSSSSGSGSGAGAAKTGEGAKDGYLVKTGIVWEACEIFEGASRSNRQAVAKKWGDMMSTMEDAIAEVQEMIDSNDDKKDTDNNGGDDEDEDEDSGNESDDSWNDEEEKLTEEEKQLSIRANAFLKLTRLLFKKLQQRCLDTQPTTSVDSTTSTTSSVTLKPSDLARMWDQLYDRAKGIVALADEIATSLYGPQDRASIIELLQELSRKNHDCILVGRLFVRGQAEHEKWMDMCEAQSKKILETVLQQ